MSVEIKLVEGYMETYMEVLGDFVKDQIDRDFQIFADALKVKHNVLNCFTYVDGKLAGYKIGFEQRPKYFESWIGAVAEKHRRKGLATAMMQKQHDWAKNHGYRIIETITTGDNAPMLIANLKAGFEVVGTFLDRKKALKVTIQKILD